MYVKRGSLVSLNVHDFDDEKASNDTWSCSLKVKISCFMEGELRNEKIGDLLVNTYLYVSISKNIK